MLFSEFRCKETASVKVLTIRKCYLRRVWGREIYFQSVTTFTDWPGVGHMSLDQCQMLIISHCHGFLMQTATRNISLHNSAHGQEKLRNTTFHWWVFIYSNRQMVWWIFIIRINSITNYDDFDMQPWSTIVAYKIKDTCYAWSHVYRSLVRSFVVCAQNKVMNKQRIFKWQFNHCKKCNLTLAMSTLSLQYAIKVVHISEKWIIF